MDEEISNPMYIPNFIKYIISVKSTKMAQLGRVNYKTIQGEERKRMDPFPSFIEYWKKQRDKSWHPFNFKV